MRAWLFLLRHRDSRNAAGLVAAEARYASVRFLVADRIERAFATPAEWREIEATRQLGLPTSALPSTHGVARVAWAPELRPTPSLPCRLGTSRATRPSKPRRGSMACSPSRWPG